MTKKVFRLTENELRKIISENVVNELRIFTSGPYSQEEINNATNHLPELIRQVEQQELPILKSSLQQKNWDSFYECLDILETEYIPQIKKLADIINGGSK